MDQPDAKFDPNLFDAQNAVVSSNVFPTTGGGMLFVVSHIEGDEVSVHAATQAALMPLGGGTYHLFKKLRGNMGILISPECEPGEYEVVLSFASVARPELQHSFYRPQGARVTVRNNAFRNPVYYFEHEMGTIATDDARRYLEKLGEYGVISSTPAHRFIR